MKTIIATRNDEIQPLYTTYIVRYFFILMMALLTLGTRFKQIPLEQPTKTALIVAIGNYPQYAAANMSWRPLSSINDIQHVKQALISQGFKEENILILKDKEATKASIIETLGNQLVAKSSEGGHVVIHFSGHGQRIFDNGNDEIDRLDEALIPFDAKKEYQEGIYTGENHLRDEELNNALGKLRKKLGPEGQVLVLLDACHAGTGLRGNATAKARGTDHIFVPKVFQDNSIINTNTFLNHDRPEWAKVVGFFATAPHQTNSECLDDKGNGVGSLSFAFGKAFARTREQDSYEILFARIRNIMAAKVPEQAPQAEGSLNQQIFGGQLTGPQNDFRIIPTGGPSSNHVKINGGELHGLTEQSTVAFYHDTVQDHRNNAPLATGKVIKNDLTTAYVKLIGSLPLENRAEIKVKVEKRRYAYTLKVKLSDDLPKTDKAYLQQQLTADAAFSLSQSPDLLVRPNPDCEQNLDVLAVNGITVSTKASSQELWVSLKNYHVANFLRHLECETPSLKAKLEIVAKDCPVKHKDGGYQMELGQHFQCRISNQGLERLYYTVIAISPSQDISVLIPLCDPDKGYKNSHTPHDTVLETNASTLDKNVFEISAPLGTDVLKLVTSREPIDLSHCITRGKRGTTAAQSPFEFLFRDFYAEGMRGEDGYTLPSGVVNVETVLVVGR